MNKELLSESELKEKIFIIYQEEKIKLLEEKWAKLSKKDKTFVLEFLKVLYPEKSKLIKEDKWYNTVGDILGIFDPTGVVDLVNGVSYWNQGDKLFAILSWISVLPYIGDVIGKTVMETLKFGGKGIAAFKAAALAGDASKIASTASKVGGPIARFVSEVGRWGVDLMNMLKKVVGKVPGLGKGLVKTIDEYVNIFKAASKEMKVGSEVAGKLASKSVTQALTKAEKDLLAQSLKKSSSFRGFRDYKGASQTMTQKYISGGMGRLWGNRATRSLMRRTKWYLGLLDFLGLGNYRGPEELENEIPNIETKIQEYSNTPQAQQYAAEEFGGYFQPQTGVTTAPPPPVQPSAQSTTKGGMDAINVLTSLLGGAKLI